MDEIALVTVTIFDADSTSGCTSNYVGEHEPLEEVIEQVKEEAAGGCAR